MSKKCRIWLNGKGLCQVRTGGTSGIFLSPSRMDKPSYNTTLIFKFLYYLINNYRYSYKTLICLLNVLFLY